MPNDWVTMAKDEAAQHQFRRAPTMQDVARRAGVSTTTVSHMLSGRRPVSSATQVRIQEAIDLLSFRPNDTARALRTQRTNVVAMILGNIAHEANPLIARGAGEVLRESGYTLAIYETNSDRHTLDEVLRSISSRRTDGAIVVLQGAHSSTFAPITDRGIPVIYVGPPNGSWARESTVYSDEEAGIALATAHVLGLTSGLIGYIGGPDGDPNAGPRKAAFERSMRSANRPLDVRQLASSPWSFAGGQAAMEALLAANERLGAVVCANDLIAIGAINYAKCAGLRVPHDMAVTGFDNIEAAAMVDPSLTTVEPFEIEVGRVSARAALSAIDKALLLAGSLDVSPTLIVRASAP